MPRKGKPQESSPYDAIRGRWEAASVAQFLKLFQYKFNFACASTQDLEEALVNAESNLLADTCARLLRFLTGSTDILISNFKQHLLAAAAEPRVPLQPGPGEHTWTALNSPEQKVGALKWLVDLCLERRGEELHDYLEETWRPDDMRGLCAGQDAFNNVYWYLDDLRLYRENNVKKASRKDWECVCVTLEDWVGFLKQFRKTNNPQERELHQYLNLELFPLIENQLRGAGSKRGELPANDKLVQEEARDVAAMLKEGQQDKAKASTETATVDSSGSLPKEETAVVNGEDRPPTSEISAASSTPGSDTLANGGGPPSAPPPTEAGCQASENSQLESKGANEGILSENSLVGATTIKAEENSNSNHEFPGDATGGCSGASAGGVPAMGIVGMATTGGPPPGAAPTGTVDGGQPLPSNVLPKQPPAEAQYMQQQSQIFVFSTTLANKAAETVFQGQFPSIIACHCAQPGTKRYLEKHPLKMAQFTRQQQNPAQWLNSLAQLKQQKSASASPVPAAAPASNSAAVPPNSGPPIKCLPPGAPPSMLTDLGMAGWNQQGGSPLVAPAPPAACQVSSPLKSCESPMMASAPMAQGSPSSQTAPMHHSPMMGPGVGSPNSMPPSMMGPQPSLTGVKVPDENLTPQQRQHREEQLATLRKMQQILFPEQQPGGGPPGVPSPGQIPPGASSAELAMMSGYPGLIPPHKNNVGNMMPQQPTPTSVAAQIEWQKLQHQFYEDRNKKKGGGRGRGQQQTQSQQQGPPPPYHQSATRSASVPAALASPGTPSSPGNAAGSMGASTLSLPSPRAASGLNSPGSYTPQQQQRCLPGPSPTAVGVDSPNSVRGTLNISNPGTPIATPGPGPSPGHKEEFSPVSQQNTVDGMFGRTLQSFAQQKQQQQQQQSSQPPKEPNLMPVPSPQQIQYLNTFEGQELTIQKQPNTSLRESDMMSPTLPATGGGPPDGSGPDPRLSGPNTPLTPSYAGPHTPHTPGGGDGRFGVLPGSPHTPGAPVSSHQSLDKSKSDPGRFPPGSPSPAGSRFPGSVPPTTPLAPSPGPPNSNFPKHPNFPPEVQSPPKLSPGPTPNFQPDNVPLNPNGGNANSGNTNNKPSSHFDPITSMAQMSQQLTNSNSPGQTNAGNMMGMNTPTSLGVGGPMPVMGPFGSPMHPHHHHHHHHHPMEGMMGMGPGGPPPGMQQHMQNMQQQQGMPPGMQSGMPQGIPQGMSQGMPQGMPPQGMAQGMPQGLPQGMPQGMPPGMQQGGPGNYPGGPPHMAPGPGGMCTGPGPGGTPPMMVGPAQQSPSPKPSGPPGMMMMQPQPPRGSPPVPGPGYPVMPMGPQQRIMLNRPPYNGANVQVKASAPNTIQYLPARPQSNNQGPRGPPSLEFLQRFANPLSNLDSKVPTHNLQYFPNNSGQGSGNSNVTMGGPNVPMSMGGSNGQQMVPVGGNMNNPMGVPMGGGGGVGPNAMIGGGGPMGSNINGPMGGGPPPNGPILGQNVPMGGMNGPMNMGGLRPPRAQGPMMRGGPPMFQQPHAPPGGPPQAGLGPDQQVFGSPSGPNAGVTMFVPGSKASPMGHAPDASQPLPPSMGQANNFKNSPFIGPTTADPNYAQQFHNFQQQLYATSTRSQMNNQAITQNQSFFGPK